MKEFVEKLIERLEVKKTEAIDKCDGGASHKAYSKTIEIVNQLAEAYKMGDISDGYHTFNELYHHRAVLFATICNSYKELAWKSKLHDTGDMYSGMFIVGIETPKGQATYHYDINPYWDMFKVTELPKAPKWDGHTPDEAIRRIAVLDNNQGWIPCSERLPEKYTPVLVMLNNKEMCVFTLETDFEDDLKVYWEDWYGYHKKINETIAWQPLPEPYKPEQQKEILTNHYTERFNRVV